MTNSIVWKLSRAAYVFRSGGPRAVLAAYKRYRGFQKSSGMLPIQQIESMSPQTEEVAGAIKPWSNVAKLRDEELVIFADKSFEFRSGHHRAAQLALVAAQSGHHVLYVEPEGFSASTVSIPGVVFMPLAEVSIQKIFSLLSEKSVLISSNISNAILPYIRYARQRGLKTWVDFSSLPTEDVLSQDLDIKEILKNVEHISASSSYLCGKIRDQFSRDAILISDAVNHSYFDVYKNFFEVHEYSIIKKFTKVLIYLPGGDDSIDWKYLSDFASINQSSRFFVLGLSSMPETLPENIIFLGEDKLNYANAFMQGADFVLAPLSVEQEYLGFEVTGLMAACFMNKHVISSKRIEFDNINNVHHMENPIRVDNKTFGNTLKNDLFVGSNSWLSRIEKFIAPLVYDDTSVIILIHNNSSIIERCLTTLIEHCSKLITEIIVVDNASTDGGAELVEQKFPNVKLVRNPANGCSSGRNLGVKHSKGKYLVFFDSDQWFVGAASFVEARAILEKNAVVGMIGWNAGWFDATRTDLGGAIADYCPNRAMNSVALRQGYRSDIGFLGTSGLWMRRETFEAIEGFDTFYDPTCFEDTDICFQVRALGMEISFRDLSGIRHQPHQTTGAGGGSKKYQELFLRNANYFKKKWENHPEFFIDYS